MVAKTGDALAAERPHGVERLQGGRREVDGARGDGRGVHGQRARLGELADRAEVLGQERRPKARVKLFGASSSHAA